MIECIRYAMYGVSKRAFTQQMPRELKGIAVGDLVFISEREVHRNVLFGPFYVTDRRQGVVVKSRSGMWCEVDTVRTPPEKLPYWAVLEGFSWCLFFDSTLADRVSIVWPNQWKALGLELPPWGLVRGENAPKLTEYAAANEVEAKDFMKRHEIG